MSSIIKSTESCNKISVETLVLIWSSTTALIIELIGPTIQKVTCPRGNTGRKHLNYIVFLSLYITYQKFSEGKKNKKCFISVSSEGFSLPLYPLYWNVPLFSSYSNFRSHSQCIGCFWETGYDLYEHWVVFVPKRC